MALSRSSIALLSLVFLSQAFSFAVTLLPSLLAGTGLFTPVEAGLVLALASLMSGFWQPLIGRWLDEGRIRTAFVIIAVAYALGIAVFIRDGADIALIILGSLALVVAMTTLRTLQSLAIVGRCQGAERAHMAGLRYLVSNSALAVAAAVAFQWLNTHRRLLLSMDLLTTLILGFGLALFLVREQRKRVAPAATSAGSLAVLRQAWNTKASQLVGISIVTIGFMGYMSYLPLLLVKRGLPAAEWNAITLFVNTATIMVGLGLVRRLTRTWSPNRLGFIGTLLIGLGLSCVPLVSSQEALIAVTLIFTIGEMIFVPWEQSTLYDCFSHAQPGLASGAITFLMTICQVLGPLFATILLTVPESIAAILLLLLPISGFALYRFGDSLPAPLRLNREEKEAA